MLPLIPLAGMALLGLGRLFAKRRQQRQQQRSASAVGQAVNTSTATPVNSVASAATSSPQTAQTPAGAANTGGQQAATPSSSEVQRRPVPQPGPSTTSPTKVGPDPDLAARLGSESITRSRRRNRQQQSALSGQALQ